jgi:hypothetical protein
MTSSSIRAATPSIGDAEESSETAGGAAGAGYCAWACAAKGPASEASSPTMVIKRRT